MSIKGFKDKTGATHRYDYEALANKPSGVGCGSGENVDQMEPAWGDIPKVFFGAPLQKTKDDAVCHFWYYSKSLTFTCWVKYKAQGNSTLGWPKKNQTVKLYKDEACTEKLKINFKGWGKQYKFVIKAYWRDLTHVRDVVSVRLESECAKSRTNYAEMPELLRTSPNMGGIDGFPVLVWADGVYQGRYMWNIPKDAWMANMDDELDTHCILCSEDYNSSCFRAAANITGNDWTDEIHDTVPASIKTRWNEVISFVQNATDEEFVANLDSYIDVESLIDRHLVGLYSCDFDGYGKNQVYMTYDGQKWYAVPYDKDGTWGVFWTGNSMLPSDYGRNQYEDMTDGKPGNLLFIRLEQLFWQRLQERWVVLRDTTLSVANTVARVRELSDITPPHIVAEDYAPTTAGGAFTGIPNKDTCTIQQIQKFAAERHTWTDEYVAGLTPVVPVPCEGITLSAEGLAFTEEGTQTLTATVVPDGCTDSITWESDNISIATVADGVVTAVANGSCNITAFCGAYSAVCAVTVSGIVEPVPCTGISLDKSTLSFTEAGTQTLTATITPEDTTDALTWESSNPRVATVENGVVTAIANGSATITAKCGSQSAECAVSVSGIVVKPLYPFKNGTKTLSGSNTITVSDGNHINIPATGCGFYNLSNLEANGTSTDASNVAATDEFFTLSAGDVVRTVVQRGTGYTETGKASVFATITHAWVERIDLLGDMTTDTENTVTISNDCVVNSIGTWVETVNQCVDATIEIYVNDVRYV